ncbi:hypothetical protein HDC92_001798 [Pedobacter sp. AK017]|uniref:hypothetical protein n=1 Tax=Pedobacter sp. AK017 TaxID=2723073 RepID=UPI001607235B|nr:hypothetical protein [Pedobacter sp. AK017]MBB5438123.1 hypothetical protein [Pedobacter sp. AK017]
MKVIMLFFEWTIKNILRQELNIINRSRLRMLSYGLMLQLVITAIIMVIGGKMQVTNMPVIGASIQLILLANQSFIGSRKPHIIT